MAYTRWKISLPGERVRFEVDDESEELYDIEGSFLGSKEDNDAEN